MIELLQNSTIHGVGHIVSATNKIWKYFWYFLLFCGIIGIFVNIVIVFMKYFSHPINLNYILEYESFQWPELTICNHRDPFMFKENSPELQYWRTSMSEFERILSNTSDDPIFNLNSTSLVSLLSVDIDRLVTSFSLQDVVKLRYHLAESVSNIFTENSYPYDLNYNDNDNTSKQIWSTNIVHTNLDIPCYTIHLFKDGKIDQKKVKSVSLNIKLGDKRNEIVNSSDIPRSIHLYITNHNHIPKEKNKFISYPGSITTLLLSQSRYHYNKDCRNKNFTVEVYDALLRGTRKIEGGYENCKEIEWQKQIVKNCGCYSSSLPIYKNSTGFPRICFNITMFSLKELNKNYECYVNTVNKLLLSENKSEVSKKLCGKFKEKKCSTLSYKVDKMTDIDFDKWIVLLKEELKADLERDMNKSGTVSGNDKNKTSNSGHVTNNQISFVIIRESRFGDFYEEVNEYPFSQLLSDVGGLMGLWLGMSVVGLFEIGAMIYKYIRNAIGKKRRGDYETNP